MKAIDLLGYDPYEGVEKLEDLVDLQGWFSCPDVFDLCLKKANPGVIIEVGSWKGASAIYMAENTPKETTIFCIDTWLGSVNLIGRKDVLEDLKKPLGMNRVYRQFLVNVVKTGFKDKIIPLALPSNMAAKVLKKRNILADLIYIDASHETDDVMQDINSWIPLLNPKNKNAHLFGDDADWPSVMRAVKTRFPRNHEVMKRKWIMTT